MSAKLTKTEQKKLVRALPKRMKTKLAKAGAKKIVAKRAGRKAPQEGKGFFGNVLKAVAPVALDLGTAYLKKRMSGKGSSGGALSAAGRGRKSGGALKLAGRGKVRTRHTTPYQ